MVIKQYISILLNTNPGVGVCFAGCLIAGNGAGGIRVPLRAGAGRRLTKAKPAARPVFFDGQVCFHYHSLMSRTLQQVRVLIESGDVRISSHGYDELAADSISVRDVVAGVMHAVVVEDYPDYGKGPAVLVLQRDAIGKPLHVLWGIPLGHETPAVLVTAYRPDPSRWSDDYLKRKR